eukprot:6614509-Alexandrium_andersonii.AAC.1
MQARRIGQAAISTTHVVMRGITLELREEQMQRACTHLKHSAEACADSLHHEGGNVNGSPVYKWPGFHKMA